MTSEQIKATPPAERSTNAWLKEVAMQLALLNEKGVNVAHGIPERRGPGRPRKVA